MIHLSYPTQRKSKWTHKSLEKLGRALEPDPADERSRQFVMKAVLPDKEEMQE